MRQRRFFQNILLAIPGAILLLVGNWLPFAGQTPAVLASSFVTGSDPVDGSTVSKPLSAVRIYFNAPISTASQASVYAFQPGGLASGELVNARQGTINPANAYELDIALLPASRLPQGSYEVRWTAVSLTDGRTTSGLIGFNLGQSSTGLSGTPTLGPSTSNYFPHLDLQGVLSVAWDWLVLLALLFWVGILVADFFVLPCSASLTLLSRVRSHARSLQVFCLLALLVGEAISLILRSTSLTATTSGGGLDLNALVQLVLHTNYGYFWLVRVFLLAVALLRLRWTEGQAQSSNGTSLSSPTSKRFSQLRQRARPEMLPEVPVSPRPTLPPVRSQARVTGAVAASVSPMRHATAALARINGSAEQEEAPLQAPSPWTVTGWLGLVGLVILTLALSNEILQLTSLPVSTGIFLWLSLTAQAVWFGLLAYLGIALLPILPVLDPDHHAEILVSVLKRAVPFFLSAIGVLLVSDTFLGEATLQEPQQLIDTPYGLALLVRVLLLLLALIFTGYMLLMLLPRLQRQTVLLPVVQAEMPARRARRFALEKTANTIRRTLHALTGLVSAALVCLALMNFFAPPVVFPNINYAASVNQPSSNASATPVSQTQQASGLSATLQVLPARVGVANMVYLALSDAGGKPVTNATVKLRVNMQAMDMGELNTTLQEQGNNPVYLAVFSASQTFTMVGPWTLQVEIDRPSQGPVHLTFQITVTQ